mgnify:CR=1 FL=1
MLILDAHPEKSARDAMFHYRKSPRRWLLNPVLAQELSDRSGNHPLQPLDGLSFLGIPIQLDWQEPFDQMTMEKILLRSIWDELLV